MPTTSTASGAPEAPVGKPSSDWRADPLLSDAEIHHFEAIEALKSGELSVSQTAWHTGNLLTPAELRHEGDRRGEQIRQDAQRNAAFEVKVEQGSGARTDAQPEDVGKDSPSPAERA